VKGVAMRDSETGGNKRNSLTNDIKEYQAKWRKHEIQISANYYRGRKGKAILEDPGIRKTEEFVWFRNGSRRIHTLLTYPLHGAVYYLKS
jgi:hypothetical protein